MPRKNTKPAAKKARNRLKAKVAAGKKFDRWASPYRAEPHHGDIALMATAAIAFGVPSRIISKRKNN